MNKIPKHLQEKLEQIKDPSLHFQCGDYTCVAHKSFKEGAAAMHSIMLEEMKPIVASIEHAMMYLSLNGVKELDKSEPDFQMYQDLKQALSHYREKIEGVK